MLLILFILILIILVAVLLLEENKINVLYKIYYTFIISGSLILIIGILMKYIIKNNINFININNAINIILNRFIIVSIIFYICGVISYIGYYLIKKIV